MKPLFTQEEYVAAKSQDKLPCECYQCGITFFKIRKEIKKVLEGTYPSYAKYCSINCRRISTFKQKEIICLNCKKTFMKRNDQIIKSKNNFCSKSCACTYNNLHKTFGIRRSKLEIYIEHELKNDYPNLAFVTNDKTVICSELDFFFTDLKIAIELNGICHYKPIYGKNKFEKIKNNDKNKIKLCFENNIDLFIIDTSKLSYNTIKNFQSYYKQIKNLINKKIRNK